MSQCQVCDGVGLVSNGADPKNLNEGTKSTCVSCGGYGQANGEVPAAPTEESKPEEGGNVVAAPKDESSSDAQPQSGEQSPEGSPLPAPQVGDPCLDEEGRSGKLARTPDGEGWVCEVSAE